MNNKMSSRLLGETSTTSDIQMVRQKKKKKTKWRGNKEPQDEGKREE